MTADAAVLAVLEALPDAKLGTPWSKAPCPAHEDKVASFGWTVHADGSVGLDCKAGCSHEAIVSALGHEMRDLFPPKERKVRRRLVDTVEHEVRDTSGAVLAVHVRQTYSDGSKSCPWRLPDGTIEDGLRGRPVASLPLYGSHVLPSWPSDGGVVIVEGEKAAGALLAAGHRALGTYGADHEPDPDRLELLRGRAITLWPDADAPGRKHMLALARRLDGIAADVRWLEPPADAPKGWDAADLLALADDPDAELARIAERIGPVPVDGAPTLEPVDAVTRSATLAECVATFRRWLHMPDAGSLYVTLAAVAANRAQGDALWLLLIGPPGGGKTESLQTLIGLPDVHAAATLTEAALLSGTPKRDKAADAKGGLLREIGPFGIIVLKDFTSILSMHRDARAAVLAALREVYDGAWTRHVGTDGGRTLTWTGKVGMLAGCTPVIDSHHAVIGSMGERFVFYRLPVADADKQVRRALSHVGHERKMRAELSAAVRRVLECADPGQLVEPADEATIGKLIAVTTLAVRCRSAVERDGRTREVELVPEAEAPARLALVLLRLWNGLRAIGCDTGTAWTLTAKAALDSMPALRRRALEYLVARDDAASTTAVAEAVEHPATTTRRALEDLTAHGILERVPQGAGKPDLWEPSAWTRDRWRTVAALTVPEMSGDSADGEANEPADGLTRPPLYTPPRVDDDFSGTVPIDTEDDYPKSAWVA